MRRFLLRRRIFSMMNEVYRCALESLSMLVVEFAELRTELEVRELERSYSGAFLAGL
jgi:hypothetical protein